MFDPQHLLNLIVVSERDGPKRKWILKIDPEDVIATAAAVVAVLFAIAVVARWLPLNAYTTGIIACSGAGAVIARIVKARRNPQTDRGK
jgi:hypothetical protein